MEGVIIRWSASCKNRSPFSQPNTNGLSTQLFWECSDLNKWEQKKKEMAIKIVDKKIEFHQKFHQMKYNVIFTLTFNLT